MGIFAEDLINFGNLLEAEIELKLTPDDLKKVFADFDFYVQDGILKIVKEKKGFIFKKKLETRLREDTKNVYNKKEEQIRCIKAYLLTPSVPKEFESVLKKESDFACMNLWEAIKGSEVYEKVPKHFKDRIVISRYFFKNGYILLYLKVEK